MHGHNKPSSGQLAPSRPHKCSICMRDQDKWIEDTLCSSGSGTSVQLASQPTQIRILGPSQGHRNEGDVGPLNLILHQDERGFGGLHCTLRVRVPIMANDAATRCSPLAHPLVRFVSVLLRSHALFAISVSTTPFVRLPISSHFYTPCTDHAR
jgi:hypothetical protein